MKSRVVYGTPPHLVVLNKYQKPMLAPPFTIKSRAVDRSTEVCFASFLSGGFITATVVNPPERKLAKCTSVLWFKLKYMTTTTRKQQGQQ